MARLKAAGAIVVGRTRMSELGISALGIDDGGSTPLNPFDRVTGKIAGGSSSGAAVSVSDRIAVAALCSDTGGSARVPAALCGLTGFKATRRSITRAGMVALAPTFDSIGVITRRMQTCKRVAGVLLGKRAPAMDRLRISNCRFIVPTAFLVDDLDPAVATAFQRALSRMSKAGARIREGHLAELAESDYLYVGAALAAAEAYDVHKAGLLEHPRLYGAEARAWLHSGAALSARDRAALSSERVTRASQLISRLRPYDALLMPTVPIIAPAVEPLLNDALRRTAINALLLRNTSLVNFIDGCAVSIPCHAGGDAPVGLTIAMMAGHDQRLLSVAASIERVIRDQAEDL